MNVNNLDHYFRVYPTKINEKLTYAVEKLQYRQTAQIGRITIEWLYQIPSPNGQILNFYIFFDDMIYVATVLRLNQWTEFVQKLVVDFFNTSVAKQLPIYQKAVRNVVKNDDEDEDDEEFDEDEDDFDEDDFDEDDFDNNYTGEKSPEEQEIEDRIDAMENGVPWFDDLPDRD